MLSAESLQSCLKIYEIYGLGCLVDVKCVSGGLCCVCGWWVVSPSVYIGLSRRRKHVCGIYGGVGLAFCVLCFLSTLLCGSGIVCGGCVPAAVYACEMNALCICTEQLGTKNEENK